MITIYTRTVCPKCLLVKNSLEAAGLEFESINTDHDEEAKNELKEMGFMAAPIMKYNGEYLADPAKMLSLIEEISEAV